MIRRIRFALALGVLVALTTATVATADASGRKVFTSVMTGLAVPGTVVAGVTGAGAAWVIEEGSATLTAGGRLHVEVEGLVLTSTGTNPVTTGRAIVSCNGAVAATTDAVPFSAAGDAEVEAAVSLPSPCLAPAVFFTSPGGKWFAVTGF